MANNGLRVHYIDYQFNMNIQCPETVISVLYSIKPERLSYGCKDAVRKEHFVYQEPEVTGKRKERQKAFHRNNILESAYELFKKKGIDGTTMDDIARHAEYSKTTIYNYFGSKEELISYLIFEGVEFFQTKLLEDAERSRNFAEFYRHFCQSISEIHTKYPLYYDGIIGAAPFDERAQLSDINKKIYISNEEINEVFEEQAAKAMTAKEIHLDGDITASILFMKFCIMGMVEKIALNEAYISYKLGRTKEEFLEFAFKKFFTLFGTPPNAPECPQEQVPPKQPLPKKHS